MVEFKPPYSLSYRQEVLGRFFDYVKSGELFYVVGAPSVGKTRLMDFLMGDNPDPLRAESESGSRPGEEALPWDGAINTNLAGSRGYESYRSGK